MIRWDGYDTLAKCTSVGTSLVNSNNRFIAYMCNQETKAYVLWVEERIS
ncbi:hypothetical protein [Streptomyces sp. NPDC101234]